MSLKKKLGVALVTTTLGASIVAAGSFAWFTDSATNNSNEFAAGTLKIAVNTNEDSPYTYNFAIGGLIQPGDIVTKDSSGSAGSSVIEIKNTGTLPTAVFNRLSLSNETGGLADQLVFTEYHMKFIKADGTTTFRTADDFVTSGTPVAGIDPNGDGKLTLREFANNNWDTPELPGWDIDSLEPGSKIQLTYQIKFDENAGNEYQGKAVSGTWETKATQINQAAIINSIPGMGDHVQYLKNNLNLQK